MALFSSLAVRWFSHESFNSDPDEEEHHHGNRGAVPIVKSPVDPKAYAWLRRKRRTEPPVPGTVKRSFTVAQFEAECSADSSLAGRLFRKQTAASSLELFFDLFFVANLAVFTDNHEHTGASSLANYIGFFAILWSIWFHIALYDVRFYTDSLLNRFVKMVFLGIFTSLVSLGPVYDSIESGGPSRAYQGLALVMMTFRFVLVLQYGVVLFFVHGFQKTLIPLSLTMVLYLLTGFAFLITYLTDATFILDGMDGAIHVYAWYIIIAVEALASVIISSIWRVLSFRHTHLVERVGLLTLIIMGEGIIGLTKSVAYVIDGTDVSILSETGIVASAVILIYFVYQLYFDNVEHDRFGSIRQQIWVLLHFALHVAILLTVEGQTALILWEAIRGGIEWCETIFPSTTNPAAGLNSTAALVTKVTEALNQTAARFYYAPLTDYYDATSDLAKLQNNTAEFASSEWNETTSETLQTIKFNIEYFIFNNFQAEASEKELDATKDIEEKVQIFNDAFKTVFAYFYIGAGALLLMLALLYWFGKTKKRADEWSSIVVRVVVGMAIPCVSAVAFLEQEGAETDVRFTRSGWIIPIVTFSYLAVLTADNLICAMFKVKDYRDKRRQSSASTLSDRDPEQDAAQSMEKSAPQKQVGFQQHPERVNSDDSELTMNTQQARPAGNNRGYSHLEQDDHDYPHGDGDEEERFSSPPKRV